MGVMRRPTRIEMIVALMLMSNCAALSLASSGRLSGVGMDQVSHASSIDVVLIDLSIAIANIVSAGVLAIFCGDCARLSRRKKHS